MFEPLLQALGLQPRDKSEHQPLRQEHMSHPMTENPVMDAMMVTLVATGFLGVERDGITPVFNHRWVDPYFAEMLKAPKFRAFIDDHLQSEYGLTVQTIEAAQAAPTIPHGIHTARLAAETRPKSYATR